MNNSINEFAYDVGCDYGFDRNTGRLSLIKRIIYNTTDNIECYRHKNRFI